MKSFLNKNVFATSFGTTLSKLAGFARTVLIGAAFGVGLTYDAYNYAYIIPGFFIIIIGGINGPIHNAIVAVITPLNNRKAQEILNRVNIKIVFSLIVVTILIFLNSNSIISIVGPDLQIETKTIAARQLKILSPCIPLAGFIGLSFGALNSKNKFFLSSVSPSIISLTTILFIGINWFYGDNDTITKNLFSSDLLSLATLAGTIIQFWVQFIELYKLDLIRFNFYWGKNTREEERIFKLILPASLSSGLGQINVFIDMLFISSFRGAASGLTYGNFLIQAPIGILSNTLILPILPKFSRLINSKNYKELKKSITSSIESCMLITFLLTGFFISLNEQIIEIIFQRGAFNYDAVLTVKGILIAYAIGMPAYLFRDLLIRTYYSIEKTKLPFTLSILGIVLNMLFDWILVGAPIKNLGNLSPYNFGVVGVVLSSGLVNLVICIILANKLEEIDLKVQSYFLFKKIILIAVTSLISGSITYFFINEIYSKEFPYILRLFILCLAALLFFIISFLTTKLFKINNLKFS